MNERVKEFLDAKKEAEKKKYEEKKQKILFEAGLYEKVYVDEYDDETFCEYDDTAQAQAYYKMAPVKVTDEEFEEIKKYIEPQDIENDKNPIATILKVIAVIVYIAGFIASFFLGVDRYGDVSAMVMVWWIVFFISGTIYLGFAEIIKLLDAIKRK